MRDLAPTEAAAMMATDPEAVWFPLTTFPLQFGLSPADVLAELQSGRLVAQGRPIEDGYDEVVVSAAALVRWVENPDTPPRLIQTWWRHMREEPQ